MMFYSLIFIGISAIFTIAGIVVGYVGVEMAISPNTYLALTGFLAVVNCIALVGFGAWSAERQGADLPLAWGFAYLIPFVGLILSIKADIAVARQVTLGGRLMN